MEDKEVSVPPDGTLTIYIDMRKDIWPARADIDVTIHNDTELRKI
jgi:hypothetical protein